MTLIRNSKVKKLLQTISRTDNPSRLPKISSSNRIPGNVETQNAAIDKRSLSNVSTVKENQHNAINDYDYFR